MTERKVVTGVQVLSADEAQWWKDEMQAGRVIMSKSNHTQQMRPVPTDKGIEGLAEIAQEALAADYGGAKGAIADAARALKRIIRRAASAEDERFEIKTTKGPTIEFTGKQLCEHEFQAGERTLLNIYLAIYQTEGGALVAESSSLLAMGGGKEFIDTIVVPPIDDVQAMRFEVMDFFDWQQGARNMVTKKLGWSLRRDVP